MEELDRQVVEIANNKNFTCNIEFIGDLPFVHAEVHNWNRKTMNDAQILFDMIVEKCEEEGVDTLSFYGSLASVKLAKCFAPLYFLERIEDQYVGGWYV